MCSSPDALHLRQLEQFAAVFTAASVLEKKKKQREWENCQKIGAKHMPQISKRGFHNPKPDEFDFYTQNILKCILH